MNNKLKMFRKKLVITKLIIVVSLLFAAEWQVLEASPNGALQKALGNRYPVYMHFQGENFSSGKWPLTDGEASFTNNANFHLIGTGATATIFGPQLNGQDWLYLNDMAATNLIPGRDEFSEGDYTIIMHLFYQGGGIFLTDKGTDATFTHMRSVYNSSFLAGDENGQNITFLNSAAGGANTLGFNRPSTEAFMMLAIVKNGSELLMYINNNLEDNVYQSSTSSTSVSAREFLAGINAIGGPGYQNTEANLKGVISEFVVFSVALGPDQIKAANDFLIKNYGVVISEITTPDITNPRSFNVGTDVVLKGTNFGPGLNPGSITGSTLYLGISRLEGSLTLWDVATTVKSWKNTEIIFTIPTNFQADSAYIASVEYGGFLSHIAEFKVMDSLKYSKLPASSQKHVEFKDLFFPIAFTASQSSIVQNFNRTYFTFSDVSSKDKVRVDVFDQEGVLVRHLTQLEPLRFGGTSISWDGKNDRGRIVRSGEYFILTVIEGKQAFYSKVYVMPNIKLKKFYFKDFLVPPSDKIN